MDKEEKEQKIIEQYQQDEKVMILVFAQWCINNELDPVSVYQQAYPSQQTNPALHEAMEQTLPPAEADHIDGQTLIEVLQTFGNDDLAFVVAEIMEEKNKR